METIREDKKVKYKIPLDKSELVESIRIDLPTNVILETCESTSSLVDHMEYRNGEISIHNYLETGLKIIGVISGLQRGEIVEKSFEIESKSNTSLAGWDYSTHSTILLSAHLVLYDGQHLNLLNEESISIHSRFKQVIFYS